MARKRKTIEVEEFKRYMNTILANSTDSVTEAREAVASVLEHVLMETGNYKGFQSTSPRVSEIGNHVVFADETRRRYF